MYYDGKAKAPTRIGYRFENGEKIRISKRTGAALE
jgi:large subunit ribosomal protein L24